MDFQQAFGIQSEGVSQDTPGPASKSGPRHDDRRSFARRQAQMAVRPATPFLVDGDRLMNPIERAPPGDVVERQPKNALKQPGLAKKRSTYFEDAFSVKNTDRVREMVEAETLVVVELKTNAKIPRLPDFIHHFSAQLALRFQRPEASIALDVLHKSCLLYGGSFEPAYILAISTLSSQLQPATNKRNTAILQKYLQDILKIPADRGCVRYMPLSEENLAYGGTTLAGRVASLQRNTSTNKSKRNDVERTDSRRGSLGRRLSMKSITSMREQAKNATAPAPISTEGPMLADVPEQEEHTNEGQTQNKMLRGTRSFPAWSRSLFRS